MQEIRMVDLQNQHARIKDELDAALNEVISTTAFIKGPQVKSFEKSLAQYLSCLSVTGCGNGTDALQLALMALDLPAGSEIITSDFTFVATAEVIALMGLKPVLVDIDPDTFNILPEAIEKAITKNTKAIIPVHLFGQCANMEAITKIAKKHNLYIVEDTAQALGSDYIWPDGKRAKAGTIGDIGTTSFFPSKNLGCMGDGGAIMTNSGELAEKISLLANHGMDKQYYYESVGVNSRLDTLQAAILEVKLRYLNEYNGKRKAAADAYTEHLQGIDEVVCPVIAPYTTHIFHQYTLKIKGEGNRDALMKHLTDLKIPVKVYYPVPLHDHKPYRLNAVYNEADLKNTIQVSNEVLSLPMHTELTPDQIDFITGAIKDFFKKK